MKKYNTHILTLTASGAQKATHFRSGFIPNEFPLADIDVDDVWVGSRNVLETDTNFKHLIPYILIEQDGKYLTYQRTPKGGEARLHGNFSIGFGGHIDVADIKVDVAGQAIDLSTTVGFSAQRELKEELNLDVADLTYLGLLHDDTNAVGAVHLGVVLKATLKSKVKVASPEDQINLQGFKTPEELLGHSEEYENWSALLINHLNRV